MLRSACALCLVLLAGSLMLLACRAQPATLVLEGQAMGTTWSVRYVGTSLTPEAARARIQAELDRVDAQMSTWRSDSDLARFNAAPAGAWQALPAELFEVLQAALVVAERSGGAWDPTVGPLVELWGFGARGPRSEPPTQAEIDAARVRVGWQRLELDAATRAVLQPGGVEVDLSSIAPGYTVDRIADALNAAGVRHFLIELGGELRSQGLRADGQPWQVAIERPTLGEGAGLEVQHVIGLRDASLGASGDYRRYFENGGERYTHHVDPHTGQSIRNDLASVTVLSPRCMDADVEAAAIRVLGPERGLAYARAQGIAALLIVRSGSGFEEHMTPGFEALLAKP